MGIVATQDASVEALGMMMAGTPLEQIQQEAGSTLATKDEEQEAD